MNTRYNLKNVCFQLNLDNVEAVRKKFSRKHPSLYGGGEIIGGEGMKAFCYLLSESFEQLEEWLKLFHLGLGEPEIPIAYLTARSDLKRAIATRNEAEKSLEEAEVRHEDDLAYHNRDKVRMREERDKAREEVRLLRQALERVNDDLFRLARWAAERLGLELREVVVEADLSEDSIDLF